MTDSDRAPGRNAVIVELADQLWDAGASRIAIDPISETWPDLTVDDAYAIQTRNVERRQAAGRVLRGRKVGLTSRPMQEFLRVFEPTFGALLDDMFAEDGAEIELDELIQPVEADSPSSSAMTSSARGSLRATRSPRSGVFCRLSRSATAASLTGGSSWPIRSRITPRRAGWCLAAGSAPSPTST